jgi:hypothetical protein
MSIVLTALLLFATADPGRAGEDAAHRADRMRTERLNRAAAGVVIRRQASDARLASAHRAARQQYERQMAAWRQRDADRRRYNDSLR